MSIQGKIFRITRWFVKMSMPDDQLSVMQLSCAISLAVDINTLEFFFFAPLNQWMKWHHKRARFERYRVAC